MSSVNTKRMPRTLTIADSYNDGTGGIQVDLKTFAALSTCGLSVITALATGTTSDEKLIHIIPEDFIISQFRVVTKGIGVDALKIGMHFSLNLIKCIGSLLTEIQVPTVVIDPVTVTTHLSTDILTILREQLLPVATLIIPTLNEAAILLDRSNIISLEDMKSAAQDLHRLGPKYVLITNDSLFFDRSEKVQSNDVEKTDIVAVLFDGSNFTLFKNSSSHITKDVNIRSTLSAAITAYLAHDIDMIVAIEHAIAYTYSSIQNLPVLADNKDLSIDNLNSEQPSVKLEPSASTDRVVIVDQQRSIHTPHILTHKRSFVQLLKNSCSQEWFDYTHHPFVEGLGNGTLPTASFKHYLVQDYIFLTHFARCHALAGYKSQNISEILVSAETICYIARETNLHLSYCATWGIDAASLACIPEARANLAYTRFTLDCGMSGDLLDLHAALAPCLFGYGEIGLRLFNDPNTKRDSPYWQWILSYASDDYQEACRKGEQLLDRLADDYGVWYGTVRMNKLTHIFKTATKLEIGFWNMGLNLEW